MKRTTFGKAAISSLLIATTMAGCNGAAFRPSVAVVKEKQNAGKLSAMAEKALARQDAPRAIQAAEAAVELAPDNVLHRQILGRAYLAAGRFGSAETALTDALTLGSTDGRTIVSLALVQVALGKSDAARAMLPDHAAYVPAADYGLALALAGDPQQGVQILTGAVQDPSVDARTRQNLAYAYALSGRWKDARVMAGQDLDPLAANQRISQWATMADPALAPQRAAALLGVEADAGDAGLPVRLALNAAPVATAAAEPLPAIAEQPADAPARTAAADPEPMAPAIIETAPPIIRAPAAPVRTAAAPAPAPRFIVEQSGQRKAAPAAPVRTAAAPAARMQRVALVRPVTGTPSNWVVQLGAYDSAAVAKAKWMSMAGANPDLAAFPVLTSQATVKGKAFHRLAVSGFANRADALTLCRSIQAQRGQCFVREGASGATPQRWAVTAPKGRQFASR